MDRLSGLPDEIVSHIVSFVSAKEAAFISVLSKRFRNLFTIIPSLNFDNSIENPESFTDFLDRVLALPPSSRVRKFSLKCYSYKVDFSIHFADINRCLCDVLKRGVMDFELDIDRYKEYSLPPQLFTCKTVVLLKLGTYIAVDVFPNNALLPALETLCLDSVQFRVLHGCAFRKLLSACPVLEELTIDNVYWQSWKWSRTISSPTLQRLTIEREDYDNFSGSEFKSIAFDTPNLTYLHYNDFVPHGYPVVNLDSLVEAKLDLLSTRIDEIWNVECPDEGDPISSNPKNLFKGLKNVEILTFLSRYTLNTFNIFREAIPVFKNLSRLSIKSDDEHFCIPSLPILLKRSPNLETLVIEGQLHYDDSKPESVCKCMSEYSCLFSCQVEVLKITEYMGTIGEVEQMKHFLGKLSCLRLVKIRTQAKCCEDKLKITRDLLMLPRASVNCKIQVEF